jgi:hypothetical protein
MFLKMGEVYRYAKVKDPSLAEIDGLKNFSYLTFTPGQKQAQLESGINPIAKLKGPEGERCPAILISSSPHKIGSSETPWQDFFDPDNGHIHYFGDNKEHGKDPGNKRGNKALLKQFELHNSPDANVRAHSSPIVFFKRVAVDGRTKGNVQFQGFGIVSGAHLITQYDRKEDQYFTNYVFDFTVFNMATENEVFDWSWISARRDSELVLSAALLKAPKSWQQWIKKGPSAFEICRRRVSKLQTFTSNEQQPLMGSREASTLKEIYDYYSSTNKMKHRFEALASIISARVITAEGGSYREGWLTSPGSDGGADFIGRLDIGSGFSKAKILVLGQAKCESMNTATGGNHIARTVARLKRGWVGVYVTTSHFSEAVQREVIEDKFPILLINGKRLAEEVNRLVVEQGFKNVSTFIKDVDAGYESKVMSRNPEEILLE